MSDNFFNVNFTMLKMSGIWIPDPKSSLIVKILYWAYNFWWIGYSCLFFCPSELVYFATTLSNLEDLVKNVNMGMTHFLANIKVCLWFYYRKEIMGIIETLGAYGRRYESYGDFDNEKILRKAKKFKDIFSVLFLNFAMFTSISSCLICFYSTVKLDVPKGGRIELKLPYFSYIPWDYRSSKILFSIAIWYQFFPVFNYAYIIVGFDTLYTAILGYVSAQLDIIQGAFSTIRPRCMVRLGLELPESILTDPPELMNEMNKEMNKIVDHLQVLLDICIRLEEIYSYVILAQVMISLIVFCTCIFLVSLLPMFSLNFAAEMIYMIAIECQLLIYCVFGNKVTLSSSNIPNSIYNGDWYSSNISFKRSMLITMSRMQRPIYFTIGKFTPLTLSTFVTISRASYSFFAVLKNSDL
uniref:Odorant receptor n=1 Tax=Holotrichia parallela TaxID=93412 RepID=A0A2P9JY75_HOLPA|nr:odorant receptor 38 [Holotrichia parallela]